MPERPLLQKAFLPERPLATALDAHSTTPSVEEHRSIKIPRAVLHVRVRRRARRSAVATGQHWDARSVGTVKAWSLRAAPLSLAAFPLPARSVFLFIVLCRGA
jgi:hypothetical protein